RSSGEKNGDSERVGERSIQVESVQKEPQGRAEKRTDEVNKSGDTTGRKLRVTLKRCGKILVSYDDAVSPEKSMRVEEEQPAENIDQLMSPFDRLPSEVVLRILSFLNIRERWMMRLNHRLVEIETMKRPHIPNLRLISCRKASTDGLTICAPPDPPYWALAKGRSIDATKAGNVIEILTRL
ncbi:hypothetical protein PMAYCL1PPCAC_25720, partial [Pristionchus mayeri]